MADAFARGLQRRKDQEHHKQEARQSRAPFGNRAQRRGPPRDIMRLKDGTLGYGVDPVRWDDCFRAAVATATQVHVDQVPDLRLEERFRAGADPHEISSSSWERIAHWADSRGLQLVFHETVPVDRERWIGVCQATLMQTEMLLLAGYLGYGDELKHVAREVDERPFSDHCLILSHDRVIFDPAASVAAPHGSRVKTWEADDVTYGISFDPQTKE